MKSWMRRPSIAAGAAALCLALFGLSTGAGSATATPEQPAGTAAAFDGPAEAPAVAVAGPGTGVRSAGTGARHDYNRDGRSDLAAWYDYADGHDAVRTFLAGSNGAFAAPGVGWETPAGNYWVENMKRLTGDFNGDGIGDLAAFYGYEDGRVTLLTWLGRGDGTFGNALHSWTAAPGNWYFDAMTVQAGDFNGDGRDDVAVWYAYGNGNDRLFTMLARTDGGFGPHTSSFERAAADGWYVNRMKFATGDFNGDGRDDLAALYGYRDGSVKLMYWAGRTDGGFAEPVHGYESTGWTFRQASLHAGDFDGDGRDDLAAWYDYADGHDAVIGFRLGTDGKFGARREMLTRPAGSYDRSRMKIVTGDYNGDGRDDLATLYGYADGRVKTITFTADSDGNLDDPLHSWESEPGNWTFSQVHMMEGYTSPTPLPYCPAVFGHGGWPTEADGWQEDQIRAANHPRGLAQEKSWGAAGVEADLRLTKNGTKAVMWHNRTTYGLTGSSAPISELTWASGSNPLNGRTITRGPYAGETVYTFREWLDSAKALGMVVLVEVKPETKEILRSSDPSVRETAWSEVLDPIKERIASQEIMIYTHDADLELDLKDRIAAAGLSKVLTGHPAWYDAIGWQEPPPPASGNYAAWQRALDADVTRLATSWTPGLTNWMDGRCV
ncbi:FG-GAP-like repeat-containing protein [Streptomyces hydrogenans]|uniref:FG-GAP-like repeat-containing protein n=1 Tax=Streptomyces hydrogenans TaxID=1873719 RepID=UPI0037FD2A2C